MTTGRSRARRCARAHMRTDGGGECLQAHVGLRTYVQRDDIGESSP